MTQNGTTITVNGFLGPDVTPGQLEQRIINPDLVDVIGKRDVRAVPGPLTRAAKGGYSSSLAFPTPTSFVATYQFDTRPVRTPRLPPTSASGPCPGRPRTPLATGRA